MSTFRSRQDLSLPLLCPLPLCFFAIPILTPLGFLFFRTAIGLFPAVPMPTLPPNVPLTAAGGQYGRVSSYDSLQNPRFAPSLCRIFSFGSPLSEGPSPRRLRSIFF